MVDAKCAVGGIASRFAEWANRSPSRIACHEVHGPTTYGELSESLNRLCHHLWSVRGDAEEPIAFVPACAPAVSALIGVLKAGKICDNSILPGLPPGSLR